MKCMLQIWRYNLSPPQQLTFSFLYQYYSDVSSSKMSCAFFSKPLLLSQARRWQLWRRICGCALWSLHRMWTDGTALSYSPLTSEAVFWTLMLMLLGKKSNLNSWCVTSVYLINHVTSLRFSWWILTHFCVM